MAGQEKFKSISCRLPIKKHDLIEEKCGDYGHNTKSPFAVAILEAAADCLSRGDDPVKVLRESRQKPVMAPPVEAKPLTSPPQSSFSKSQKSGEASVPLSPEAEQFVHAALSQVDDRLGSFAAISVELIRQVGGLSDNEVEAWIAKVLPNFASIKDDSKGGGNSNN